MFTATGVHAALVAGSVASVRHNQPQLLLSAVLVLCTVVPVVVVPNHAAKPTGATPEKAEAPKLAVTVSPCSVAAT